VVKEVVFRAEHAGEIPFSCAVICGLEHWQMRGKLIVKEG
jgi:heme/copper-type cytochrome/quinol oxidase subunit 2